MSTEIGGVGRPGPGGPAGAAAADPQTQARLLQKEVDSLLQQTRLRMQVDVEAGRVVVQVIDAGSGELLRQIPRDEALQLAREMARRQATGIRA